MPRLSEKVVISGFALAVLLLGGTDAASYVQVQQLNETRRSVQHTYEVLESIHTVLGRVEAVGRERRSYILTGGEDAIALKEFADNAKKVDRTIAKIQQLTKDNLDQQRRLEAVKLLIAKRRSLLQQSFRLFQQNSFNESAQTAISKQSLNLYQEIESKFQAMIAVERALLEQRSKTVDSNVRRTIWLNGMGHIVAVSLLTAVFSLLLQQIRDRRQAEQSLQHANDRLEINVQNRTLELAQLNAALKTDLTERKLAAQALLKSEKQLRLITDALPVLISYMDSEQRYQFNNHAYEVWFGASQKDLTGRHLRLVVGELAYQTIQPYAETVLSGQEVNYDVELPYQDGGTRWVHATYIPDFGEQGEVKGYFALISDISEAKRYEAERQHTEAQIRQSEQRLHRILQNMPVMLDAFDENWNIIEWNCECERVTGYRADEAVGNPHVMELLYPHEVYRQQMLQAWRDRGNHYHHWEWEITCKDGSIKTISWSNISDQFPISGWSSWGIGIDVSDLKQAEAALNQMNEALEIKVQERTAELNETNANLTRSNQELEQFAYVASHDLQEPLRAVSGYTQLLAKCYTHQLDETGQQYAAYVMEGAARMQQLIQDLLEYSRVSSRELMLAPTDCNAVLKQVLDILQVAIAESHATITSDPLPILTADKTQLNQLFQNLIGNAIKFRREEPPAIHISATWSRGEGRSHRSGSLAARQELLKNSNSVLPATPSAESVALFSVRDNGIGIKPRYLERIFEIFKRLHTRREFPGTGIGLAICKKIVDRYKGDIWATSEPGIGTTFYFTLPQPSIPHPSYGTSKPQLNRNSVD